MARFSTLETFRPLLPSPHPPNTHPFIHFLSIPNVPGTVNRAVLSPVPTLTLTLHLSNPQACSFSLLVSTLCTCHSLQLECLSFCYPLWVTYVSGSAQLSPLPRKPFLTDCRGASFGPHSHLSRPLSIWPPVCLCLHLAIQVPKASTGSPHGASSRQTSVVGCEPLGAWD